ncbi:MAG: hypothetical protein IIC84_01925 [Chloroflexi bacterium]|nr:hypothetical protein [Chloroflexota bacterium]
MLGNVFVLLILYLRVGGINEQIWPIVDWLSSRLLLSNENNIAVWWSGFLLMLLSVHAFDGYVLHRETKPLVAKGWAALSLLMIIFSADEISSLHERTVFFLEFISLDWGTWLSLLPFGLITLVILIAALVLLGSDPEHRKKLRPILTAFFLFGTVAIQEYMETKVNWGQWASLRVVAEEGTELLGMSILLKTFMPNSFRFNNGRQTGSVFDVTRALRLPLIFGGLIIAPVLGYATAGLTDQFRGQPSDWFASTIFVFAALAVARPILFGEARFGLARGGLIAVCLAASVAVVSADEDWVVTLSSLPAMNLKMLLMGMLALMAATLWPITHLCSVRIYLPATFLLVGLILVSIFQTSLFMTFTMPVIFGIVVYYVHSSENRIRDTSNLSARVRLLFKPTRRTSL